MIGRDDFFNARKVPIIMGRGEPWGTVIGIDVLRDMVDQMNGVQATNEDIRLLVLETNKKPKCLRLLVTEKHPDVMFAITRRELPDISDILNDYTLESLH